MKLLYRPFGLIVSVLGGILAGQVFNRLWRGEDVPKPKEKHRGWAEVVGGAALHGAVYGGVKAMVDRAGRTGYERATGTWPGPVVPK